MKRPMVAQDLMRSRKSMKVKMGMRAPRSQLKTPTTKAHTIKGTRAKMIATRLDPTRNMSKKAQAWLPDGNSQTLRSYLFGPSVFWTMALLRYAAKFDPFFPWIAPPRPPPWRNPRKGRDHNLQRSIAKAAKP